MSRELYCGVDLHSNNGVYAVVEKSGVQVWRRRLPNKPEAVLAALAPFQKELVTVAIESTYNWYWLADCLEDAGYRVELANPAAIEQYNGLKNTDDDSDAAFLAELLRFGILPKGWICPRGERALRDLLRRRMLLVTSRTRLVLSLQSMIARETGQSIRLAETEDMSTEELESLLKHAELLLVAQSELELIHKYDEMIRRIEEHAMSKCRPRPEYALLTSVPGIGRILAMVIMLEIGDIKRFPKPGDLSSYCRAVKTQRTSNNKKKGENNRRNGNRYLSWAFIEAANGAIRSCATARAWYQRKAAKTLPVVGRKALASKWSKAVWYMLRENKPFCMELVFG